jgi:hypothetical protein
LSGFVLGSRLKKCGKVQPMEFFNQTENSMTTKRMTGKDYRKAMNDHYEEIEVLKTRIHKRFDELRKKYPEAIIEEAVAWKEKKEMRCKDVSDHWFEIMGWVQELKYIEMVEKWSADQQKIKQLYLEIPDELKDTLKRLSD